MYHHRQLGFWLCHGQLQDSSALLSHFLAQRNCIKSHPRQKIIRSQIVFLYHSDFGGIVKFYKQSQFRKLCFFCSCSSIFFKVLDHLFIYNFQYSFRINMKSSMRSTVPCSRMSYQRTLSISIAKHAYSRTRTKISSRNVFYSDLTADWDIGVFFN